MIPRFGRRLVFCFLALCSCAVSAAGQDRPLTTPEVETIPAGTLRAQVGFDFVQDATFPLSGLNGDLTSVGVLNLRLGVARIAEVQLQGVVHNFLQIGKRGASFTTLKLPSANSTGDVGDFSLWTKVRILGESGLRPGAAFRFGFEMPNSKQSRGIGTNTTNVYASGIVQKHLGKLNLFGDVGLGILQAPLKTFSQNDVVLYGGAFSYPVGRRLQLAGEIAGRRSTRTITPDLIGTESHSQARFGFRLLAGGFQWDVAGIAGLEGADPLAGFTFGVSRDFHLFRRSH